MFKYLAIDGAVSLKTLESNVRTQEKNFRLSLVDAQWLDYTEAMSGATKFINILIFKELTGTQISQVNLTFEKDKKVNGVLIFSKQLYERNILQEIDCWR